MPTPRDHIDRPAAAEPPASSWVDTAYSGTVRVVALRGEIDVMTSPHVWREVQEVVDAAGAGAVVVVDLTGVVFLDSLAISSLLNLDQRARRHDIGLRLVAEPDQFARRVLDLAGLHPRIPVHDSVADAAGPPG
jgi:anti-anti-sigma factor